MSYHKISIADILRAVKYAPETDNGICTQRLIRIWPSPKKYEAMKDAMSEWPKHSNCRVYPVPESENNPDAAVAMMHYNLVRFEGKSMWDANTEYGRLRYELLDWLIKHPDLQQPLWKRGRSI